MMSLFQNKADMKATLVLPLEQWLLGWNLIQETEELVQGNTLVEQYLESTGK